MQKLFAKSFQHKRDCYDSVRLCRPFGRLYGYSQKRRVRHFVFNKLYAFLSIRMASEGVDFHGFYRSD